MRSEMMSEIASGESQSEVIVSPAMAVSYCFAVTIVALVVGIVNMLFLLFTPVTVFS